MNFAFFEFFVFKNILAVILFCFWTANYRN